MSARFLVSPTGTVTFFFMKKQLNTVLKNKGLKGYWIHSEGYVTGPWGRKMAEYMNHRGFKFVKCRGRNVLLHRALAIAFIPRKNKSHVKFKDGNKLNYSLDNLYWDSSQGKTVWGSDHHNSKLDDEKVAEIKRLFNEGAFMRDVAEQFGVTINTLYAIIKGITWKHVDVPLTRKKWAKPPYTKGPKGNPKLTKEQVFEMLLSKKPSTEIAHLYPVSSRMINLIREGKAWAGADELLIKERLKLTNEGYQEAAEVVRYGIGDKKCVDCKEYWYLEEDGCGYVVLKSRIDGFFKVNGKLKTLADYDETDKELRLGRKRRKVRRHV